MMRMSALALTNAFDKDIISSRSWSQDQFVSSSKRAHW